MQIETFSQRSTRLKSFLGRKHFFLMILSACLLSITVQSNSYNILTSMQSTNQTFMAYLPYLQQCNYTSSYISPQTISLQYMTALNLFQYYQNAQRISFWSSIQNGMDIFMSKSTLLAGYSGIIYRPEIYNFYQQDLSQNSSNDIVTLFKTQADGSLIISFVEVFVQKTNNFTVQSTVLQVINVTISSDLRTLIQTCVQNKQDVVISQLQQEYYIGVCKNTSAVFFWSLQQNYTDTIINFTNLNSSYEMPINQMILNPVLEAFGVSQIGWNVFLLTNGSTQSYECQFDPLNVTGFACYNQSQLGEQFQVLLEKLWSEQSSVQQIKLQKLISHMGPNATQKFPGKINSIFIDTDDNIYVQSITDTNLTYLNIYDWKKTQILSISFFGKVLLYNQLQFLILDQQSADYIIMTVELPLLTFGINDLKTGTDGLSYYSITLPCTSGVDNLTMGFDIFMSNIDYPTSYTKQLQVPNLYSTLSIYTFQLQKYFNLFGPGYTVYFKGHPDLQATLLDASIISMSTYILSIVQLIVSQSTSNSIFKSSNFVYTTQTQVYHYSAGSQTHSKIASHPCGIKSALKGIKVGNTQTLYYGYMTSQQDVLLYCLCPDTKVQYNKCKKVQKSQVRSNIMKNTEKISNKIDKLNKLSLLGDSSDKNVNDINCDSCINSRLFDIADAGLVVTILNDNSVTLSSFPPGTTYDQTNVQCDNNGQLVGAIYVKQFYEPTIFLFCEKSQFLSQYRIRSNKFIFERIIPIYGFITRPDSSNIIVGANYIFLQVQIDEQQNSSINVDPVNTHCCVLRIDPFVDTVSSVKEVIFVKNIKQVYQCSGVDVAYYQGSQVTQADSFLKIYLDETWLAINQTNNQVLIGNYNFKIAFVSINYNMASQFDVSILYNMTSLGLVSNVSPLPQIIELSDVFESSAPQNYVTTINFNYNGIQGPMLQTSISSSDSPQMIEDVELNDIIVQTKIVGTVGSQYLQIFTPMDGRTNTTFDNTIIVVGSNSISVYLKEFANQQLYLVKSFTPEYENCEYFPYAILNSTAIQFFSQCAVPQFDLKTPIIIMNLVISQPIPILTPFEFLGRINIRLSNLQTLVFPNITFVIGIDQGPMQSLTGKLKYCSSRQGECSDLYISSKEYFLLYYDVFIYGQNQFIITTLDFQYIQVWVNPSIPDNMTSFPSNYTIYIPQFISEDIAIISITNVNQTSFSAILSGTVAYYEIVYWFAEENLQILTTFQRYANCEQFDRFPVSVILDESNQVMALVAECGQNQDTLRLQTYERMNQTDIVIYTGHLQYFTRSGPVSYLATNSIPSYNPIRLLQLSTTMLNKLFLIYFLPSTPSQLKLIYEQINGILADNIIYLYSSLSITLSPLTNNLEFPTLYFTIENDFYMIDYQIETKLKPLNQLTKVEYACLVVLIACNLCNAVVMVFYAVYLRQKKGKNVKQRDSLAVKSWADDDHSPRGFKEFKKKFKDSITGLTIGSRKDTTYQRKDNFGEAISNDLRKATQIQLFSRRSQRSVFIKDGSKIRQK